MLFRWRRRRDPLASAWQELTSRLGLERAEGGESMITELLDLPDDAAVSPVHRVEQAGSAQVYVFWYRREAGSRAQPPSFSTACLLTSEKSISPVSWRASRKVHEVIASLQASATGGEVIAVPGAEEFNQRVTVVARDGLAVERLLNTATRRVLERTVSRTDPAPTLTVGERRLLLSISAPQPAFDAVEFLLTDVLSLYAALESA
jgi:hypothetical protein